MSLESGFISVDGFMQRLEDSGQLPPRRQLPKGFLGSLLRVSALDSYPDITEWAQTFLGVDFLERKSQLQAGIDELLLKMDTEQLVEELVNDFFRQMYDNFSSVPFPNDYVGYQVDMTDTECRHRRPDYSNVGSATIQAVGMRLSSDKLASGLNDIFRPYIDGGLITPVDKVKSAITPRSGASFTIFLSVPVRSDEAPVEN